MFDTLSKMISALDLLKRAKAHKSDFQRGSKYPSPAVHAPNPSIPEKKLNDIKPDWYLAAVCNRQFDDKLFFECLTVGKNSVFSLPKLDGCDSADLGDLERIKCVQGAQVALGDSFQSNQVLRKPASLPSKKTKSKTTSVKPSH